MLNQISMGTIFTMIGVFMMIAGFAREIHFATNHLRRNEPSEKISLKGKRIEGQESRAWKLFLVCGIILCFMDPLVLRVSIGLVVIVLLLVIASIALGLLASGSLILRRLISPIPSTKTCQSNCS